MEQIYRIKIRDKDFEVEVESHEKEYVDSQIKEFFENRTKFNPPSSVSKQNGNSDHNLKKESLMEFVNHIKPDSGTEYVLAVGYYCEKFENLEKMKTNDISQRFKKIKYKHANPSVAISGAMKQAYLMDIDKNGGFVLSKSGEEWIEKRIEKNKNK